ncbi:MAG TPA: hypothetical protein VMV91_12245 [Rhodocyclaceae bacterium]|nr:hypothetical protein [Rhodocyclaceae bacterium]
MGIVDWLQRTFSGATTVPMEQVASNPARVVLRGDDKPLEAVPEPSWVTVGELQDVPMPSWMADGCRGLEFCATMQLRTPLRVLLRHGEIHTDMTKSPPPRIQQAMWEGIWIPVAKSFEEVAIGPESTADDIEFFRRLDAGLARRTVASHIGPVLAEDYLPFLIAVRRIVEADDTIKTRIDKLREMLSVCDWQEFLGKHGGTEGIVQYFFPRHIAPMPKLPAGTAGELARLGLETPARISAAPDAVLLGTKGIGPAKLRAMRAHCADMAKHRDAGRVENVGR